MRKWLLLGFVLSLTACGSTPAAPTPPPAPANVAGNWTGNLASSNWPTQATNMVLAQTGTSVSGTWSTPAGGADWNGQVTGTVDPTSFTGTVTLSAPNALGVGPRCTGTASLSGPAGGSTIRWTGAGFTGSCTGEPIALIFNFQRQ